MRVYILGALVLLCCGCEFGEPLPVPSAVVHSPSGASVDFLSDPPPKVVRDPNHLYGRRYDIAAGFTDLSTEKVLAYRLRWAKQGYQLPELNGVANRPTVPSFPVSIQEDEVGDKIKTVVVNEGPCDCCAVEPLTCEDLPDTLYVTIADHLCFNEFTIEVNKILDEPWFTYSAYGDGKITPVFTSCGDEDWNVEVRIRCHEGSFNVDVQIYNNSHLSEQQAGGSVPVTSVYSPVDIDLLLNEAFFGAADCEAFGVCVQSSYEYLVSVTE